ncbi:zinc ribbon domain-containing protein [uncultured Methanobrevibacter sp.]
MEKRPGRPRYKNSKFCGNCGSSLTSVCHNCGASVALYTKFCGECGTKMD